MSKLAQCLVSICLVEEGELASEIEAIGALADFCERQLQYWEIIYVAGESLRGEIHAAAQRIAPLKNLRIVMVRDGLGYYRRRKVGVSEAIGDVVVLTSFVEMAKADLIGFAADAMQSGRIVIGYRARRRRELFPPLVHSLVGLISNYRVDRRVLKTIALPRNPLAAVMARPTALIDLRFEPKRGMLSYLRKEIALARGGGEAGLRQRLELLAEIISTSASRFLFAFTLAGSSVALLALSYGLYAVVVILTQDGVQPGWFSTAIAQSGTAAFLSVGLSVIALGIGNIVDRLDAGPRHEVIDEIGNISFYDRIHDLNVELGSQLSEADA